MNDPSENRRQFRVGIFFFLFLFGALAAPAQTAKSNPDLSGKWALKEVQPSVAALLPPRSVESFSITLTIEQSGEVFKVTTVTKQQYQNRTPKEDELTSVKTYYLDGRGETNLYETRSGTRQGESITESKGEKIIITRFRTELKPNKKREILWIEEWFLKGDGLIVSQESRLIGAEVYQSGRRQIFVRV